MPFGFLGTLASGIGKVAKFLGGGIKSGIGKLGELGQMEGGDAGAASGGIFPHPKVLNPKLPRPSVPMTPGFNPSAPMPDLQGGKGGMFAKGFDLINRQQPQPNAPPTLPRPSPILTTGNPLTDIEAIERFQKQPSSSDVIGDMERLSSQVNANNREGRQGLLPMPETQTQLIPERAVPTVRVPDFLGTPGATKEDTPMNRREYEYQTQYMKDGRIPRRWQDIAMNALHGAAQGFQAGGGLGGALGGAIAGGAGSAISPLHARAFRFNAEQRPRLMEQQAETERLQDRDFEMQKRGADLEGLRARTQATIAGTKDAELERQYRQAQIEKMNAETQARLTGRPQRFMEYDPQTGLVYESFFYPDGRIERGGQSGGAQIKREGFENQRKIGEARNAAGMERVIQQGKDAYKRTQLKQSGATGRTVITQDRIDKRHKDKLGASTIPPIDSVPYGPPVKRASKADVNDFAREKKITPAEAKARFEAKGYYIVE